MARDTEGILGKKKEKERDVKTEKVEQKEQPGKIGLRYNIGRWILSSVCCHPL